MTGLEFSSTSIPGLIKVDLIVNQDNRGWFKENYRQDQVDQSSLIPGFKPLQNNVSFNVAIGVTRGIHAEPWNKYISVASGKVFAAIVDLRPGVAFGTKECFEITPEVAIFVPKGCGNSFQTTEVNTAYTYLVDDYWAPEAKYTSVNLADPALNIPWPIPLDQAEISDKDRAHPTLAELKLNGD